MLVCQDTTDTAVEKMKAVAEKKSNQVYTNFSSPRIEIVQVITRVPMWQENVIKVKEKEPKNLPLALAELVGQVKKCAALEV